MISEKDLHATYDSGAQSTHMNGLKAVWAKAIEWYREQTAAAALESQPLPLIDLAHPTEPTAGAPRRMV